MGKMRQEIKKEKSNMNIRKSSTEDDHRNMQNSDRNPKCTMIVQN